MEDVDDFIKSISVHKASTKTQCSNCDEWVEQSSKVMIHIAGRKIEICEACAIRLMEKLKEYFAVKSIYGLHLIR